MGIIEKQTKARRIKNLLRKHKRFIGTYLDTVDFEEPIMMFARRSGKVEWYERATQGQFRFKHSEGDERFITLTSKKLMNFDYGKKTFKGYWCHEDYPTPLPEEPVVTAEIFTIAQEKTLNSINKFEAQKLRATGDMWKKVLLAIAVIIAIIT